MNLRRVKGINFGKPFPVMDMKIEDLTYFSLPSQHTIARDTSARY